MQRVRLSAAAVLFVLSTIPGCLALGGKIELDDPETKSRLESLETRVSALESATGVRR